MTIFTFPSVQLMSWFHVLSPFLTCIKFILSFQASVTSLIVGFFVLLGSHLLFKESFVILTPTYLAAIIDASTP